MAIGDTGTWTDPRDGQIYPTKVMKDGVTWMTKNYNFKTADSVCYDNNEANGANYGRLYNWQDATNHLPEGWHIPNQDEWNNLYFKYNDARNFDGLYKGGTDRYGKNYGFNAVKGGIWTKERGFTGLEADFCNYLCSSMGGEQQGKVFHWLCAMTNIISMSGGTPDEDYKASCRLIISGY